MLVSFVIATSYICYCALFTNKDTLTQQFFFMSVCKTFTDTGQFYLTCLLVLHIYSDFWSLLMLFAIANGRVSLALQISGNSLLGFPSY